MPLKPEILREYDIRGTIGKNINFSDALELGRRFGTWLIQKGYQNPLVAVGRDGRLSSPDLFLNLTQGLRDAGIDVLDIGIGPTPMLYFATKVTPAVAGIMITGSHNPKEDNGFKITLKEDPFFGQQIQSLSTQDFLPSAQKGTLESIEILPSYVQRLLQDYNVPSPKNKKLKIAWDPGNGASGEVVELLTHNLQGEHILLNTEIDGHFPNHHPDPSIEENVNQLREATCNHHCNLGIAFDGDADRIGVLDEKGRLIPGDQLFLLLAQALLKEIPGATIIADIKTSQTVFDALQKNGAKVHMGKSGHSLIKNMMKKTTAHFAGEMSGHVFYADKYYGYDDGLYAAIRLLNLLQESPLSLAQLYDEIPKHHSTPEIRLSCDDSQKFIMIDQIRETLYQHEEKFNDIDGIRLSNEHGWWLIRASNTQPAIIVRCESPTKEGLECLKKQIQILLQPYNLEIS